MRLRKLFKFEQFKEQQEIVEKYGATFTSGHMANVAQHILNEALEKAIVVYGYGIENLSDWRTEATKSGMETHRALLVEIEEIKESKTETYIESGVSINNEILYKKVFR